MENITRYKHRMGWDLPWYSSAENDFNKDFNITTEKNEYPGMSVFIREGNRVFRTYFIPIYGGGGMMNTKQALNKIKNGGSIQNKRGR